MTDPLEIQNEEAAPKKTGWRGPPGSINKKGRPKEEDRQDLDTKTNKELRDRELLMLLRKLKPHVATAVMTAVKVMEGDSTDVNKLKAAEMVLKNFHRMVLDVYDGEDEQEGEEIQKQSVPLFSLRMIETDDKEEPDQSE